MKHSLASSFPLTVIRPQPHRINLAITAGCNNRCLGCRYGRDFLKGHKLELGVVKHALDDSAAAGFDTVHLYGGEPLLHPDLPRMVEHSLGLGLRTYITTNGVLLLEKFDELHAAGLRHVCVGCYGIGVEYDEYVGRSHFDRLTAGLETIRDRYDGEVTLQLNFVLAKQWGTIEALLNAWGFAEQYDMTFRVDLAHYSLPYFTLGPNDELAFVPNDNPALQGITERMLELKAAHPMRFIESPMAIRSIPDWLMLGPEMPVPCDAYHMISVRPDGEIRLCDAAFPLGNLNESRLSKILYTETHRLACVDAFQLNCPTCSCRRNSRIQTHAPSRRRYR